MWFLFFFFSFIRLHPYLPWVGWISLIRIKVNKNSKLTIDPKLQLDILYLELF